MRGLTLIVVATLLVAFEASAVEVEFTDREPANAQVLAAHLTRLHESNIAAPALADSAASALQAVGHLDAVARYKHSRLEITAGPLFYLKKLVPASSSAYSGKTFTDAVLFTPQNVESAMTDLLQPIWDSGYFYAGTTVNNLLRDGSDITVNVTINKGPKVRVGRIILSGLARSQEQSVREYIDLKDGDILAATVLRQVQTDAGRIPFVNFLPPVNVLPRPGYTEADIELQFSERRLLQIFGGVGIAPDDPSGLLWNLDLKLQNPFGTGRAAQVKSERREKGRRRLEIAYRQPLHITGRGELGVNIATRDYRDDFYEFAAGAEYSTRIRRNMTAGLNLTGKRVTGSGGGASYSAYIAAFKLERSSVKSTVNSTSGNAISGNAISGYAVSGYAMSGYAISGLTTSMSLSITRRSDTVSNSGRRYHDLRSDLAASLNHGLSGRLQNLISFEYRGIHSAGDKLPLSELFLIGGPGTLRGYRNEQFAATQVLLGTIEPRIHVRAGYLFGFYDAAWFSKYSQASGNGSDVETAYRDGYGFGLALFGNSNSIRMSLGWSRLTDFDQPRLALELRSDL